MIMAIHPHAISNLEFPYAVPVEVFANGKIVVNRSMIPYRFVFPCPLTCTTHTCIYMHTHACARTHTHTSRTALHLRRLTQTSAPIGISVGGERREDLPHWSSCVH